MKNCKLIFLLLFFFSCNKEENIPDNHKINISFYGTEYLDTTTVFKTAFLEMADSLRTHDSINIIPAKKSGYAINVDSLKGKSIIEVPPCVYLQYKDKIDKYFTKAFITKRGAEKSPYYSGYFVTRKDKPLNIDTLKNKKIVFYYVQKNDFEANRVIGLSASGYVIPLFHLYKENIITAPSIKAITINKKWSCREEASHDAVLKAILNEENNLCIGFEGKKPDSNFYVIESYDTIPEDIVFISKKFNDTERGIITNWLGTFFHTRNNVSFDNPLAKQIQSHDLGSDFFNKLYLYSDDSEKYNNAYNELEKKRKIVLESEGHQYYFKYLKNLSYLIAFLFFACAIVTFRFIVAKQIIEIQYDKICHFLATQNIIFESKLKRKLLDRLAKRIRLYSTITFLCFIELSKFITENIWGDDEIFTVISIILSILLSISFEFFEPHKYIHSNNASKNNFRFITPEIRFIKQEQKTI